jgi:hypothetical protein
LGNNLNSSWSIRKTINPKDSQKWFIEEVEKMGVPKSLKDILNVVLKKENDFVKWPAKPLLLWQGCDRVPESGEVRRYHKYPSEIKNLMKQEGIHTDSRPNGPAITSFLYAGGERPIRIGSTNKWSIHHLYSGKFTYPNKSALPFHAIKHHSHFTQSAGLLAVHPIIDALFDEIPAVSWLYRYKSFQKFGYDPMCVFSNKKHDTLGFIRGTSCDIIYVNKK